MDDYDGEMSEFRLAEIKARLAEPPPIRAIANGNHDKSPVAQYLALLRSDQIELLREVERLRAAAGVGGRSLEKVGKGS